jgi:quercetin dioxygenase-like cupin family protein
MFYFPKMSGVRVRISLLTMLAALATVSGASSQAQRPTTAEPQSVFSGQDAPWVKGETATFSGEVAVQRLISHQGDVRVSRVRFQAGAHTKWHVHLGGQVLYIESGHGLVQKWGGEVTQVGPGDVVYTAPGEKHWHGATSEGPMTQLAISIGETEWRESVQEPSPTPKR